MNHIEGKDKVSIVIPCYNSASYLGKCVESALSQDWPNTEVIVVDDGSKDNSLEILRTFGDKITVITGPNEGGNAARNKGIRRASGKWIQFLDADDCLRLDAVSRKLAAKKGELDTPCCKVQISRQGAFDPRSDGPDFWSRTYFDLETIIVHGSPQTAAPIHLRSHILAIGGFDETKRCAQEFDLHLRLAAELGVKFYVEDWVGVDMTPHPESVSRKAAWRMHVAHFASLEKILNHPQFSTNKGIRAAIAQRYASLAAKCARDGAIDESKLVAKRAREVHASWPKREYRSFFSALAARILSIPRYEILKRKLSR